MSYSDSDSEPLALSSHALDALAQFNAERDARADEFERLKSQVDERAKKGAFTIESFTEDWQESQFWYTHDTAVALARELLDGATPSTNIAVVSAPSVFVAMKNLLVEWPEAQRPNVILLEHDERFGVFGSEFVFFDYRQPFKLPAHLKGSIDRAILDPPFLNEDCQTKSAMTLRWMLKAMGAPRLLIATGERMQTLILRLYKPFGAKTTTFIPDHARELGNDFRCYANYKSPRWSWMETAVAA